LKVSLWPVLEEFASLLSGSCFHEQYLFSFLELGVEGPKLSEGYMEFEIADNGSGEGTCGL
jgi:hypothetical protein